MRWSLILSAFITVLSILSVVSLALVTTPNFVGLEKRVPTAKASSKTYRKNAESHQYAYKFGQDGSVGREKLKPEDRLANGQTVLKVPKTDADHVFEYQMLNNHLKQHGLSHDKLHPDLQKKVKDIFNSPENMAPIPASVNRAKGQLTKQSLKGKGPRKADNARDNYTLLTYGTARNTAKKLDQAFTDHGHDFGKKTFHNTLRNSMHHAKILNKGDPSPPGSSKASSDHGSSSGHKASPRKSFPVGGRKRKPAFPPRRSARIAAQAANKSGKK